MENSLLRMYLINASANSKVEKIHEFFEKLGNDLQNLPDWKDWFGRRHHLFTITYIVSIYCKFCLYSFAIYQKP